jgi:mono/diheme cytochrome c family protein
MIMHSDSYNHLSENDLRALVAYVRSVPPVDHEVPALKTAPMGRILVALGLFDSETMPLIPAEVIDHDAPFAQAPPEDITVDYGRYVTTIALCTICHGKELKGGPPVEEGAPPAPDITPYGGVWTEEQFLSTLRTGTTPAGRELNPDVMPWAVFARMTDVELQAIRMYIASLSGA